MRRPLLFLAALTTALLPACGVFNQPVDDPDDLAIGPADNGLVGIGGLAEEYDRVAERRGVAIPPISRPLGLAASGLCMLGVGLIPVLGVSTLVVMLVYLRSVARAADLIVGEAG